MEFLWGSDLVSKGSNVPNFFVWAQRAKNGAPLQRVQIIKGTINQFDAEPKEIVYDVVCSNGAKVCLLYTSPSPRDGLLSRMPSSA